MRSQFTQSPAHPTVGLGAGGSDYFSDDACVLAQAQIERLIRGFSERVLVMCLVEVHSMNLWSIYKITPTAKHLQYFPDASSL